MKPNFLLAPMAEISHRALRELIENFGKNGDRRPDEYFTEMISASSLLGGGSNEKYYIDAQPCPERTVYQLVGHDKEQLARAAAALGRVDNGGREVLGIDINMGCSAPAITRTGAGVRWMNDIDAAGEMISLVRKEMRGRLSVKMRTGAGDDFDYLLRFCRRLEEAGVDLITLHPRTAKEKFKRSARWDYVAALRGELGIPVVGNGDVSSAAEMIERTPLCDGVMVGRLAVKCPWIFAEAGRFPEKYPIDADFLRDTGLLFLELLAKYQPPEFHLSRARRFFLYYCDNLKWGNYVKNQINRESDLAGIGRAWEKVFSENIEL
jgi:tRNA-dihydrouridine synthase